MAKYDFSGYATRSNLQCADGRTILRDAFKDCDGQTVPLVWQHVHDGVDNVLGHALLENRDDGVYCYCSFNNTSGGQNAKECVRHGDVKALSIYANRLKQRGQDVVHGVIREVSLVLAGANPGAYIDNLSFAHSDGTADFIDDEAIIKFYDVDSLAHAIDDEEDLKPEPKLVDDAPKAKTIGDVLDTMNEEQKEAVSQLIAELMDKEDDDSDEDEEDGEDLEHADGITIGEILETIPPEYHESIDHIINAALSGERGELTQEDLAIIDELTPEQQGAIEQALDAAAADLYPDELDDDSDDDDADDPDAPVDDDESDEDAPASDDGDNNGNGDGDAVAAHANSEGAIMKFNVFDAETGENTVLSHDDMGAIFADAQRMGSLKDATLAHGITDIEVLFPEVQAVNKAPQQLVRRMEWVSAVINGAHKSPFSRIKSTAANLTEDEARARGYIKGNKKIEEQIMALKRVTTPQTIYKLQKLDRDDIIDITDFDVVAWIKDEMRTMLDEEIARAVLIGDGRLSSDESKINPLNIRPVWGDEPTYVTNRVIGTSGMTAKERAAEFVDQVIRSKRFYKGTGTPTMFIGPDLLVELRLLKDAQGYRRYKTDQELADDMRVSKIVEVELFDDQTRSVDGKTRQLGAVVLNMSDYTIGANKGGEVTMFDDFDIDYNKYSYLLETRICGALTMPLSALTFEFDETATTSTGDTSSAWPTGSTGETGSTGDTDGD